MVYNRAMSPQSSEDTEVSSAATAVQPAAGALPAGMEVLVHEGRAYAYVVRADASSDRTTFVTPLQLNLQLGLIVYKGGSQIKAHRHLPVERTKLGTMEAILVRSGLCDVDLYDDSQQKIATRMLGPGDLVLLVYGGHGFRMREDTVLLELKEGPYVEGSDKVVFDDSRQ